jgi:hypothetical protein
MAAAEASAPSVKQLVEPFAQRWNWDCGIACCFMVLRAREAAQRAQQRLSGQEQLAAMLALQPAASPRGLPTYEELVAEMGTRSVWTIDLAHALARRGLPPLFFTTCAGVAQHHAGVDYYSAQLDSDRPRVNALFAAAAERGIRVRVEALSDAQLVELLRSERSLAICLVDAHVLNASEPVASDAEAAAAGCNVRSGEDASGAASAAKYQGHYVLLLDVSQSGKEAALAEDGEEAESARGRLLVSFIDPFAAKGEARRRSVTLDKLRAARSAAGTDDDVLVLSL